MYLRTLSWSVVTSKNNIYSSIQIFCKDLNNLSVYVSLKSLSTYIVQFEDIINEDELIDIYDLYKPIDAWYSVIDDYSIAMRDANIENKYLFEKDPQGLLPSFWQARNIKPYGYIYIEKYDFLSTTNSYCDLEIRTSEEFIYNTYSDVKINTTKLFWDIEVMAPDRNFTDAENPSHEIFMISIVSEINNKVNAYILTTKNTETFKEAIFLKYETEKDLIVGFFDLWKKIKPDRTLNYNGDSYDMPYVLDRAKLYKIKLPSLSKLLFPSSVIKAFHPSPIGYEYDKTIFSPGVEKLDLITYFRRFYPGNENYRLETIGKLYLGEGKSGLEIEEMFKIVESNDPVKMKEVSWYSYKDSIILYDLYNKLDIENKIESLCNDLACTSEELLRLREKDLIERMFYNIDYGIVMIGEMKIENITHLIPFKSKVYTNLYVNKYDDILDLSLSQYNFNVEYINKIRNKMKHLPTYMKSMIIYSNYVPIDIKYNLKKLLLLIQGIDAIDNNYIYTTIPSVKYLSLVDKYDYLFVITPSSMIIYKNGILRRIGLHKISRPKYEYMKISVDLFLLDYIAGKNGSDTSIGSEAYGKNIVDRRENIKSLSKIDNNLFIINEKIKSSSSYKDKKNIKYKISEKQTDIITTWINVKYVYIPEGFQIINNDKSFILDYKKYVDDINDVYKILRSITK